MKKKTNTTNLDAKRSLKKDERGLSTVEYIILLVLIAAAAVALWGTFGTMVTTKLGDATTAIEDVL